MRLFTIFDEKEHKFKEMKDAHLWIKSFCLEVFGFAALVCLPFVVCQFLVGASLGSLPESPDWLSEPSSLASAESVSSDISPLESEPSVK